MNRNTELHFSQTPQIDIKRSKFEVSHSHKTTFNTGDIVPVFVDSDILPGDTVQMDMAELIRMATPIYPIMDNLYMDVYWFFVPHRLVWEHWAEFWGENEDPWIQQTEYEIPQINAPAGGWKEGTIADYMGVPTKVDNFSINALPFRAYAKIWNDWFRDQNLKQACHIYTDETTRDGQNGDEQDYTYVTGVEKGGKPAKAAKMHDYFTSALPAPQKGPAVTVPAGLAGEGIVTFPTGTYATLVGSQTSGTAQLIPVGAFSQNHNMTTDPMQITNVMGTGTTKQVLAAGKDSAANTQTIPTFVSTVIASGGEKMGDLKPRNLWSVINEGKANLEGTYDVMFDLSQATLTTISALRTAFAIQKYYENAGLHGTRYIEYIRSVFGVTSSDARMQRAEYLGGQRIPINIDQIIQTSSTDATTPQGNAAGFSCTLNSADMFTKSFEEHGTLMCMAVVRTEHTYQQGLKKMWTRKKWLDFYNPFFASLSEQPVECRNLYLQGNEQDTEAFGYQEAWADYRYKENYLSGYMRSNANGSLDVWHFADNYNAMPTLGTTWIDEPYENVDRTIAVTSDLTHQFIADFYFKTYYTRPMPVYSVPGLIDHV